MIYYGRVATTLGEAYIAVKADLRPFTRELKGELEKVVDGFEKRINDSFNNLRLGDTDAKGLGSKLGDEFGDGFTDMFGRKLGNKNKPPWLAIPAAFAAALDDGISALPTEVKASIVAGILSAVPLVSAGLAGAVAAGIGAGFAVLGTVLAFQFDEVQERGARFVDNMRVRLVEAARPFGVAVLSALDTIETRVQTRLGPLLDRIFSKSAGFLGGLTEGALDTLEFILESVANNIDELGPFVEELSLGFGTLGAAIGEAFETLIDTGEAGQEGLRDLIFLVAGLITGTAQLLAFFTEIYGTLRNMAEDPVIAFFMGPLFSAFVNNSNRAAESTGQFGVANTELEPTFNGIISKTKDEEKSLKDLVKQLDAARDATFKLIDGQIAFERSLDELDEALEKNGKTLAFETEKGRQNLEALGDAIKDAQQDAENRYQQGKLNAEQAQALYDAEIAKIIAVAKAHGVTEAAIRAVYGQAIKLVNLPNLDPTPLERLAAAGKAAADALARAAREAERLRGATGNRPWGGGPQEFADGGIVNSPTFGVVGEAGREVVIPLTKPARAAQLLQQSGLDQMLGGNGRTFVQVYIGNEAIDERMVRIVESNNTIQTFSLAYGARA